MSNAHAKLGTSAYPELRLFTTGILVEMKKFEEEKSGIWQSFGVDEETCVRFPTFESTSIHFEFSLKFSILLIAP